MKTKICNSCILSITLKSPLVFSLQDSAVYIHLPDGMNQVYESMRPI